MIIAVDFDGILTTDAGCFPRIGPPNDGMIGLMKELIADGHEVILWTCRVDKPLQEAVTWCAERGINFCAVNDNAPSNKAKYMKEYPNGTRKVYADIYIDDHNLEYIESVSKFCEGYAQMNTIKILRRITKCHEES